MIKQSLVAGAIAAVFAMLPAVAFGGVAIPAAWSGSAASNVVVSDGPGDQAGPRVAPAPDGGVWIAWFSDSNDGYDMRIQRFDALGKKMLGANGLLVAARPGTRQTFRFGLTTDAAGDALLAFRVLDSAGAARLEVQKVASDGTLLWGKDGVRLGDTAGSITSVLFPRITTTSDGDIVVGWMRSGEMIFARLAGDGTPVWKHDVVITDPHGALLSLGCLLPADNGAAILAYVRSPSPNGPNSLFVEKLEAGGTSAWTTTVFGGQERSVPSGQLPDCAGDGDGGIVLTWGSSSASHQSYVQHLLADGSEVFAHNGVAVSTDTTDQQVNPALIYDADTGNTFVFWKKEHQTALVTPTGVRGQVIDAEGKRAWGDEGVIVAPIMKSAVPSLSLVPAPGDGAIVFYVYGSDTGAVDQKIHAARLDVSGKFLWTPAVVNVSTTPRLSGNLSSALTSSGMAVLAWESKTSFTGHRDIFAQNVNIDGRLGNHTPVASDTAFTIYANTIEHGTLEASSPDGEPLVFSIIGQPAHGTVTLDNPGSGAYTYTPNADYSGSDSFTFIASNGAINSNVAMVSITVQGRLCPGGGGPPCHPIGGPVSSGAFGWFALATLLGLALAGICTRRRHS